MRLMFIGADHEVTGSCHYLEVGNTKLFVDCGMEQGTNIYENVEPPVPYSDLDFVLVTHSHIDHVGLLPYIYARGFREESLRRWRPVICVTSCFETVHTFRRWRRNGRTEKPAVPESRRWSLSMRWQMQRELSVILRGMITER